MRTDASQAPKPTHLGWLSRDFSIVATVGLLCWAVSQSYAATGWLALGVVGAVVGFVGIYVVCYICHEWGHLLGAYATGAVMPLNHYKGFAIGRFDIATHSRRQFLGLSWGGVIGYSVTGLAALLAYSLVASNWVMTGVAVGGLAFVSQSLAVDLPQIVRVMRGSDAVTVNQQGASREIILKRTWQTWLPLTLLVVVWHL